MSTELLLEVNQAATVQDFCAPGSFTVRLQNIGDKLSRPSRSIFSKVSAGVSHSAKTPQGFNYSNNGLFQGDSVHFIQ